MIFAAAALMAYVTGINSPVAVGAAIAFVVVRTLYSVFYIANVPIARCLRLGLRPPLMFAIGSMSSGTLIVLSILQANSSTTLP